MRLSSTSGQICTSGDLGAVIGLTLSRDVRHANRPSRRAPAARCSFDLGQLSRKKRVFGKLGNEFAQLSTRHLRFFSRNAANASKIFANGRK